MIYIPVDQRENPTPPVTQQVPSLAEKVVGTVRKYIPVDDREPQAPADTEKANVGGMVDSVFDSPGKAESLGISPRSAPFGFSQQVKEAVASKPQEEDNRPLWDKILGVSHYDSAQFPEKKGVTITDPIRKVEIGEPDITELRKILYAEIGNRSPEKRALEANVVINTALNRLAENKRRGRGPQTLADVLKEKNQYQGYKSKQYQLVEKGEANTKKLEAIDQVLMQLRTKGLKDNTNGAFYYVHQPNGTIVFDDTRPLYK